MKVQFLFAWYDLWIGIYFDQKDRKLYILPLPMIGIVILFSKKTIKPVNFLSNERGALGKHECKEKVLHEPEYKSNKKGNLKRSKSSPFRKLI